MGCAFYHPTFYSAASPPPSRYISNIGADDLGSFFPFFFARREENRLPPSLDLVGAPDFCALFLSLGTLSCRHVGHFLFLPPFSSVVARGTPFFMVRSPESAPAGFFILIVGSKRDANAFFSL